MQHKEYRDNSLNGNGFLGWIGRLIAIAIILGITSFFTPGFSINGLWSLFIAAIVITVLDYVVELFMGVDASPIGKGVKGFFIAVVIIYVAQFFVPNMNVSIIGSILAAAVIGILDAVLPGRMM